MKEYIIETRETRYNRYLVRADSDQAAADQILYGDGGEEIPLKTNYISEEIQCITEVRPDLKLVS